NYNHGSGCRRIVRMFGYLLIHYMACLGNSGWGEGISLHRRWPLDRFLGECISSRRQNYAGLDVAKGADREWHLRTLFFCFVDGREYHCLSGHRLDNERPYDRAAPGAAQHKIICKPRALGVSQEWKQFSLALRERAGVRGKQLPGGRLQKWLAYSKC